MSDSALRNLRCPKCRQALIFGSQGYFCTACKTAVSDISGKPTFLDEKIFKSFSGDLNTGLLNRLKTFLRRNSFLYNVLFYVFSPALFLGKSPASFFKSLPKNSFVVDIGSGSKSAGSSIVSVDIYPWETVDIVADAHNLPFLDDSVDAVITTWTFEHLRYPIKAIKEIYRILKPGGKLYLSTNFIIPYHSSPNDYYRWTKDGLLVLLEDFEVLELKPNAGPTCALLLVIQDWVSLALSFNVKFLKEAVWLAMVLLTFPFKVLDLVLIRYSRASDLAAGFYCVGRKPAQ